MDTSTIAVCGATGKQGGAVLDSLIEDGRWNLVALSRDPDGPRARAIRERGVEVRPADLDDPDSLVTAFVGVDRVYGLSTPETAEGKVDSEMDRRHGINVVDACVANDIQHLVMSSVLYVEERQEERLDYIRPKKETEDYIALRGVPHTIIRPASFMDEIGGEYLPVKRGVVTGQADGDAKIPYVACRDIGRLAAMAFAHPDDFLGRKINLIGDFLTGDDLAEVLTRVTGRPHRHKAPPVILMRIFAREWIPLRRSFEAWGRPPHPPAMLEGIEESRSLLPDILTFEDYIRSTGLAPTN